MKVNMGKTDRTIRIFLGFIALGLGFGLQSWWGLIGVPLIFTGVTGWCPLYMPFGISTKKA